MAILNYTTTVNADKTLSEICNILAKNGANQIVTNYNGEGIIESVSFLAVVNGVPVRFVLPANPKAMRARLIKQRVPKKYQTHAHAVNVCWRIIKSWIVAQIELIENEQASMATIFLPYGVMKNGQTVADNLLGEKSQDFLLGA